MNRNERTNEKIFQFCAFQQKSSITPVFWSKTPKNLIRREFLFQAQLLFKSRKTHAWDTFTSKSHGISNLHPRLTFYVSVK